TVDIRLLEYAVIGKSGCRTAEVPAAGRDKRRPPRRTHGGMSAQVISGGSCSHLSRLLSPGIRAAAASGVCFAGKGGYRNRPPSSKTVAAANAPMIGSSLRDFVSCCSPFC
ncbi:hypothetical protein, partial [Virgisporangium aliadipatigenens]|uniref:hypothetical protein n=1 Tax=Virgisporangium aliadipatigenens TaxID=741659 RepID=UPI0019442D85